MVSKASDDLPLPDNPVNTINASRGISRSTFFRLCSRAPRTWMVLPASAGDLLTILAMHSVLCLPPSQPALQRRRALGRWSARDKRGHADILVHVRPVNALPARDQLPFAALCAAGVQQPGKPRERNGDTATIGQIDGQSVGGRSNRDGK